MLTAQSGTSQFTALGYLVLLGAVSTVRVHTTNFTSGAIISFKALADRLHLMFHAGHPHLLESMHGALPQLQQVALDPLSRQMAAERPLFRSSATLTFPLPSHVADSSMTCQTPIQQRHLDSSMSGPSSGNQQTAVTSCACYACCDQSHHLSPSCWGERPVNDRS